MGKTVRRELGLTEENWVLAADGGTGVTVSAFLFGRSLSKAIVQAAVIKLVSRRPFLRSRIVYVGQKLFFELSEKTVLVEELPNPFVAQDHREEEEEAAKEMWLKLVDLEMNILFPQTRPTPVFEVHLYNSGLPDGSSLVVLRSHSASGDMPCTGPIGSEFLNFLKEAVQKGQSGDAEGAPAGLEEQLQQKATLDDGGFVENFEYDRALEKSIPKGAAKKPFWAQGKDIIGYGLGGLRQAYLPFRNTQQKRKSQLIRASLSKDATDRLLNMCKSNSSDLYGALCSAGLKSVATYKKTGNKGELYHTVILYNCRGELDPKLAEDALGFYHAALSKTVHVAENNDYWKLAAACTKDFQDGIKKRKHFTDMGSLNMLMVQAINHPGLTPASTLRTAMLSILYDPTIETTKGEVKEVLKLKDFVSTSSSQGVGPCFGIFHSLRDGALHLSIVYCSPVFAHRDIQTIVDSIVGHITV